MALIQQIKDRVTNNIIYPITKTKAVYDDNNNLLDDVLADKVDKVTGKGLSTEDYTSAEKTKLGGIEAGADITDSANVKSAGATMGVKMNGTELSKDSDGNVDVPIPTDSTVGVVRVRNVCGFTLGPNNTGILMSTNADLSTYNDAANYYNIGKGTLETIKTDLTKRAGATMGVKVAGTEATKDSEGKVNIPIAGRNAYGVTRFHENRGTTKDTGGYIAAVTRTFAEYGTDGDFLFVGKGTLENLINGGYIQKGHTTQTVTIAVGDWTNKQAIKSVTGVTASNLVQLSPSSKLDAERMALDGIYCTAQGSGTLTFTCDTVPSASISLGVVIW